MLESSGDKIPSLFLRSYRFLVIPFHRLIISAILFPPLQDIPLQRFDRLFSSRSLAPHPVPSEMVNKRLELVVSYPIRCFSCRVLLIPFYFLSRHLLDLWDQYNDSAYTWVYINHGSGQIPSHPRRTLRQDHCHGQA
jgi:hypothetical protein